MRRTLLHLSCTIANLNDQKKVFLVIATGNTAWGEVETDSMLFAHLGEDITQGSALVHIVYYTNIRIV